MVFEKGIHLVTIQMKWQFREIISSTLLFILEINLYLFLYHLKYIEIFFAYYLLKYFLFFFFIYSMILSHYWREKQTSNVSSLPSFLQ